MEWTLEPFFTRWLSPSTTKADMVLSVSLGVGTSASTRRCVGFLIDGSGSTEKTIPPAGLSILEMEVESTLTAIEALPVGTDYFVLFFTEYVKVIVSPTRFTGLLSEDVRGKMRAITPGGGTKFAPALAQAYDFIKTDYESIPCILMLLTDGKSNDKAHVLDKILVQMGDSCRVHARGVGLEWHPEALRKIAEATSGDAMMTPSDMDGMRRSFLDVTNAAGSVAVKDVRLRLVVPRTSRLVSVRQAVPVEIDLLSRVRSVDERVLEIPLGAWGEESRDFLLGFEFGALPPGERMMVCRASLVVRDREVTAPAPMVVDWSTDPSLTDRRDGVVAHYRGEAEKVQAINEGVSALSIGDLDIATARLGLAARLAAESGDTETLARIGRVAEIVDASAGTVRVKASQGTSKAAVMDLDVSSTRTVRARRA